MAATIVENNRSCGPSTKMYSSKPYQLQEEKVVLPNVMYPMKSYHESSKSPLDPVGESSPFEALEKRQEDVLSRLEQLRSSVSNLKQKYNVQEKSTTASTPVKKPTSSLGKGMLDLVINVDPASVPYSLMILCSQLCESYAVLMSTFVHSSVSDSVPANLRNLLSSNGSLKRSDAQIAISLVWKKVSNGPQLIVDPTRHTPIMGEVNIARYINRLLNPGVDSEDIIKATQIDELLDLAQLQIVLGSTKEKSGAMRSLNASLGKAEWLGVSEPCVADVVVWSVLQQTGLAATPPAHVKKWLALCKQHSLFQTAAACVS